MNRKGIPHLIGNSRTATDESAAWVVIRKETEQEQTGGPIAVVPASPGISGPYAMSLSDLRRCMNCLLTG